MKVLIHINGGVLVAVYAGDAEIEVELFDQDDLREYPIENKLRLEDEFQIKKEELLQVYP